MLTEFSQAHSREAVGVDLDLPNLSADPGRFVKPILVHQPGADTESNFKGAGPNEECYRRNIIVLGHNRQI